MPTNNFKLFDENKSNLITDTEYQNSTQRLNGVQTGVASSQLHNKFAYQVSLVAYAIAQTMNANGLDASDSLSVSAFVGNLQGTLLQKVADRATSVEAAAGVLNNKYITPQTLNAAALLLSGGVMQGALDMAGNRITNLPTPSDSADAATKGYVDNIPYTRTKLFVSTDILVPDGSKNVKINSYLEDDVTYEDLYNCIGLVFSSTSIVKVVGGNYQRAAMRLSMYDDYQSSSNFDIYYFYSTIHDIVIYDTSVYYNKSNLSDSSTNSYIANSERYVMSSGNVKILRVGVNKSVTFIAGGSDSTYYGQGCHLDIIGIF